MAEPIRREIRYCIFSEIKSEWLKHDPVLLDGELGLEKDTNEIKIGDGASRYSELPYVRIRAKVDNLDTLMAERVDWTTYNDFVNFTDTKLQHIEMSVGNIDKAVYADEGKLYRDRLEFREGSPWAVRAEVGVQIKNGGYTYIPQIKGKVKLSFKAQGDSAKKENIFIWTDDGTGDDKYITKVSDSTGLYSCVLDIVNDVKISTLGAPGVIFKFWDFKTEEVVV